MNISHTKEREVEKQGEQKRKESMEEGREGEMWGGGVDEGTEVRKERIKVRLEVSVENKEDGGKTWGLVKVEDYNWKWCEE